MTVSVTLNSEVLDADVTITDVDGFDRAEDIATHGIVDVYLTDSDQHEINVEIEAEAAYLLWKALGKSELVMEFIEGDRETEEEKTGIPATGEL